MDTEDKHSPLYAWCAVALIHGDRLCKSFDAWLQAEAEHRFHVGWVNNGRDAEWKDTAAKYSHRLTFGRLWQLTADIQAFINAAAQVEKCVRAIGADGFADPPPRSVDSRRTEFRGALGEPVRVHGEAREGKVARPHY